MARNNYQYGTSPRKLSPEEIRENRLQRSQRNRVQKEPRLRVVNDVSRQEVKISSSQKKRHIKLTVFAILAFAVLLAISYQNSQINVKFSQMQEQKKELANIQKENEQLEVNIENSLNIKNIEKEAKEQLGMEKLTSKQTVYVNLPKKDYVEAATEKVVVQEEKSWLQKVVDWIFPK